MSDRVKYAEEHESCDDSGDELPDQAEQTPGNDIHDGLKMTDHGESFLQSTLTNLGTQMSVEIIQNLYYWSLSVPRLQTGQE